MGAAHATAADSAFGWRQRLSPVRKDTEEWSDMASLIAARSWDYHETYDELEIVVQKLYRVLRTPEESLDQRRADTQYGDPSLLFHGSTLEGAEDLAQGGFSLPVKTGAFGKGIYFGRCPLKAANYQTEEASMRWKLRQQMGEKFFGRDHLTGEHQVMLLCDVYLGRKLTERNRCALPFYKDMESAESLMPATCDLVTGPHRCVAWWASGCARFDSLHAPGGGSPCCNVVPVSEFVVYDIKQVLPKYLIEFDLRRRPKTDLEKGPPVGKSMIRIAAADQHRGGPLREELLPEQQEMTTAVAH
jgi:hypothetical protein